MNKTIYTGSAGCGERKTTSTGLYIKDNIKSNNFIYIAPTRKLLTKTQEAFEKMGVTTDIICSDKDYKNKESIGIRIEKYIKDVVKHHKKGKVLFITHTAYFNLPEYLKLDKFEIFIDEIPQIDEFHTLELKYNSNILRRHLKVDELAPVNDQLSRIIPNKSFNELRNIVETKSKKDGIYQYLLPIFKDVLNDNLDVFVDVASWDKTNKDGRIYFISMLKPDKFINCTLLGAHIEKNMLYHWFSEHHKVKFTDNPEIRKNLIPPMDLKGRVEIQYFLSNDDKQWSKTFRDFTLKNGDRVMDYMNTEIKKVVGDNPFLFTANDDYVENNYKNSLNELPNCEHIPVDSKGINSYQDYEIIVHIPALNRKTKHFNMLASLGISSEIVQESTGLEILYQNGMRTALRDIDSNKIVIIITPSEREVDYLLNVFGGSKKQISEIEYREFTNYTKLQADHRTDVKKLKQEIITDGNIILKDNYISFTFHEEVSDFTIVNYAPDSKNHKDFKKFLRNCSKEIIEEKELNDLINPSIYGIPDNQDLDSYRITKNFVQSSFLVLDFDNGNFSKDNFIDIFNNKNKLCFIICNSFSRSAEQPNRFRVFMPFLKPATTIQEHYDAFDYIERIIVSNDYNSQEIGLDKNSRSPIQSFYLPCINRSEPDHSFYAVYGWKSTEMMGKRAIDIDKIKTIQPVANFDFNNVIDISKYAGKKVEKMNDARIKYKSIPVGQQLRDGGFYTAGLSLLNYCTLPEIREFLTELAGNEQKFIDRIDGKMEDYEDLLSKVA